MKSSATYGYAASQLDCDFLSTKPLVINNCGMIRTSTKTAINHNIRFRKDYMLIYLYEGSGRLVIDNDISNISKGSLIYLPPNSPINFSFEIDSQHYWIHLSGTAADAILSTAGIKHIGIYNIGFNQKICNNFFEIIFRLSLGFDDTNMLFALSHFYEILGLFSQNIDNFKPASIFDSKIQKALKYMHLHYNENHPLDFYANLCNMSLSAFNHSFSSNVKISPRNYINSLKIDNAKRLIMETELSMKEIAFAVGYDDPLYFSRIFKKFVGVSPSNFLKK